MYWIPQHFLYSLDFDWELKTLPICIQFQSPEILLNNELFEELYFSKAFQDRLILKVIDEAHMIYSWGLVESGKSKDLAAHGKTADNGIFRPSYGNLGARLMAADHAPILLMSATCRPIAIAAILVSLKITEDNINFIHAELTRPELRFIRVHLKSSLASAEDLLRLIPTQSAVPDEESVPLLVYSPTQNHTLDVLQMLNRARGTPEDLANGMSTYTRRFHAATGEVDKTVRVSDYGAGNYRVIAATLALGMGTNWSKVREVIVFGRQDPSNLLQMGGRCGRDCRPGLTIFLMEASRLKGKNTIRDFEDVVVQSDDDRMDALAITPVCLRIAFAIDNKYGHIPLSTTHPDYICEAAQEKAEGFSLCQCSNCDADGAKRLIQFHKTLTMSNFDEAITKGFADGLKPPPETLIGKDCPKKAGPAQPLPCPPLHRLQKDDLLKDLASRIIHVFKSLVLRGNVDVELEDLLTDKQTWLLCRNHDSLANGSLDFRSIFGSEPIRGTFSLLLETFAEWKTSPGFLAHTEALLDAQLAADQAYLDKCIIAEEKEARKLARETKKAEKAARAAVIQAAREAQEAELALAQEVQERVYWSQEAQTFVELKGRLYGPSHSVRLHSHSSIMIIILHLQSHPAHSLHYYHFQYPNPEKASDDQHNPNEDCSDAQL